MTDANKEMLPDHRIPASRCPHCQAQHDTAFGPDGQAPSAGDLSVCAKCATLLRFGDDLHPCLLTEEDMASIDTDTLQQLHLFQMVVRAMVASRASREQSYTIVGDGRAIYCRHCKRTSWNSNDVAHKYCANCHVFHEDNRDKEEQQ